MECGIYPAFPSSLKKHEQLGEGGTQLFVAIYYLKTPKKARPNFQIKLNIFVRQVPQAGIEPTTLALGVLCSVHLSYWGMGKIIPYSCVSFQPLLY